MIKPSVPNIWTAQEKVLHLYKVAALGLGMLSVFLIVMTLIMSFRNPLVVLRSQDMQEFYPSERKAAPPTHADVEAFTKKFLASLYVWNEFSSDKLALEISPFSVPELVSKVVNGQSQKYVKELKSKHLEQAITFVHPDVQSDKVVVTFYRVLKIEGIPLVIPTTVTLNMILGSSTNLNPMGIYVSGITEADSAK